MQITEFDRIMYKELCRRKKILIEPLAEEYEVHKGVIEHCFKKLEKARLCKFKTPNKVIWVKYTTS